MGKLNEDRIVTFNAGIGRDSTCELCLLGDSELYVQEAGDYIGPEDIDCVVFSDTGSEWPHTYELLPTIRRMCADMGVPFYVLRKPEACGECGWRTWFADKKEGGVTRLPPWVLRRAPIHEKAEAGMYHYRPSVMDDYQSRETVVSLAKGDCTDNHKIQPIRRLINDLSIERFGMNNRQWGGAVGRGDRDPHLSLIGYAADEQGRLNNGQGRSPRYHTEGFPLIAMDITKDMEHEILREHGLDDTLKSGCFVCPYQPAGWWWALSVAEPELWAKALEYEKTALARNPKMPATGFKKKGQPGTIEEMVRHWRERNPRAEVPSVLAKTYSQDAGAARSEMKELSG